MPFSASNPISFDLSSDLCGNQGVPLLISSRGRYIWSEQPFSFELAGTGITLPSGSGVVMVSDGHGSLKGAYQAAVQAHFPSSGKLPPEEFFTEPQYNTWIELNHHQTQEKVVEYAERIIAHGFPPGILMIDAGWSDYFGHFDFHSGRFPAPKVMMKRLKELGFKVMLWVCPFISADSPNYRLLRNRPGWLLKDAQDRPAILEWWDGYSVHLDLTNPEAMAWLRGELSRLQSDYGVDGFKFDAGDTLHYKSGPTSTGNASPTGFTELWAKFGLEYPYNELRAGWKCSGQPIVQRLADRSPLWDKSGLASLIPNGLAMGMIGHPFVCPDMIGGGDYIHFNAPGYKVDEELFVRSAQVSALFPMMQFSCAPWRVLSERGKQLCLAAAQLHQRFGNLILEEAKKSAATGEPMARSLEYEYPNSGYATVTDQFMLGRDVLVAPMLSPGATTRLVRIPPGQWMDDLGTSITGPAEVEITVPLERIPHWRRV